MVGSDSMDDSESVAGFDSKSTMGSNSASSASSVLGTLAGSESAHSATEECFHPTILQLAKGNFQHYARWPHSMYIPHEGTPFDSVRILHRYNTGLILDLILLLD